MSRRLATIEKIRDIQPIEGADAIEKIKIKDWFCVSQKNTFKAGDLCVYCEVDSLLPADNPAFAFLAKGNKTKTMHIDGIDYTGYRLKTKKLRGQLSQGLALPINALLSEEETYSIGEDVSERLKIVKYEVPIPACLAGKVKGQFPGFLRKTDEERVQNLGATLQLVQGTEMYITEKLDGSSGTFYKKDGVLGVCSRNLELLETEGNTLWELANTYKLAEVLPEGVAIQGEIVGEGIQNNPLKLHGHELYVFNVYDFVAKRFFDYAELVDFCTKHQLKIVPLVDTQYTLHANAEVLLDLANGMSALNSTVPREGLVFRPLIESIMEVKGQPQRMSFKAISNSYLLEHE